MSRPRFLADEDLRHSIVRAVRRLEPTLQMTTIVEVGLSSASDEAVLEYAWQHTLLLLSHDVNTMKSFAEQRVAESNCLLAPVNSCENSRQWVVSGRSRSYTSSHKSHKAR